MRKLQMAKALGFTNAIGKLSREERMKNPSGTYGLDYNSLRESVLDTFPELSDLLPPSVTLATSQYGEKFTEEKYGEILTFCEQLFHLLDTVGD
ncbi:MAG TPA: hypothetical protein VJT67_04895 [Longimicrobiaceae bacterium]|nr:hypothetical protein [Longimicrobiaceae bacterium]